MSVSTEWVGQVRAVVEAIRQAKGSEPTSETEAWRALQGDQLQAPPPLDTSPRASRLREINRIAIAYRWTHVIARALDNHRVGYLADLADSQIEALYERMRAYEDAAMHGFSSPDEPAAY